MISASAEYLAKINNGEIPLMRMQLTTASGRVIWLEDGQFWGSGVSFSNAVCQDGAFTVGSAVIGSYNFTLTNFDRSLDGIDFAGAVVVPFTYFTINGTNEYLPKGIFYVTSHVTSGNIIKCTAMDGLKLLDQSQTSITYPITVQSLVETLCTANNLTLATTTIPNGDFTLTEPTNASDEPMVLTDRQMLSYACQCIGCFARMNENGEMVIGWFDFENPVSISTTFDGKSLWTTPIEVTGVEISYEGESETIKVLYGTDDRIIKVENNPYINADNAPTVYANISANIFNVEFRPGTLPLLSNPCLQAGDVLQVTDRANSTVYLMPITQTTYNKTLVQNVICAFEQKEDADLRPSASYNMSVSVRNAIEQAQAADELAQLAHDLAETGNYHLYIESNKGFSFVGDTTVEYTATIYDVDMNEVDPNGTEYIYRWWIAKDETSSRYFDGGKTISFYVDDALCNTIAGIYFETKEVSEGINPFTLAKRNDSIILTNRAGVPLTVRAAESVTA